MFTMENARGIVRPLVTFGLVAATIALAFMWATGAALAEPAFAALSPFTAMIVTFWFKDREGESGSERSTTVTTTASGPNPPPPAATVTVDSPGTTPPKP